MIDVPLSFCAWFLVLLIQVVVHFEVIYRRKANVEVTAEAHLIDSEDSAPPAKDERRPLAKYPDKNALKYIPPSGLTRVNSDPALDDTDTCDFDDEPPNLQQRLRQTGDEMMSSCRSLENFVKEQILAQTSNRLSNALSDNFEASLWSFAFVSWLSSLSSCIQ